jgi:hypothetical protein
MVTVAGTVATLVVLLLSEKMTPPAGAGVANVIVPVDVLPPIKY